MAMNKDFYRNLPGMVCIMLDKYITKYKNEPWFPKAWEEYRQYILNSSMDDMKMPGYVFNKYVKKDAIKHFATQDSRYEIFHQDSDVIYGVPQQKKFPLPDADHVRSAIKFFNYVEPKYEAQLARAILKRAEMYNVDLSEMNIGDENRFKKYLANSELKHYGITGQKWGVRRYENYDGTLTPEGRERYRYGKYTVEQSKRNGADNVIVKDKNRDMSLEISKEAFRVLEKEAAENTIKTISEMSNTPVSQIEKLLDEMDEETAGYINGLIDSVMETSLDKIFDALDKRVNKETSKSKRE